MRYQKPKGTKDFLPPEAKRATALEEKFRKVCSLFGCQEIRTPILEHSELFLRTTGEGSDIVQKEMYLFKDKGGRELALRPEGTPGVLRAVIEGKLKLPLRLFYLGPMFRYEKPQKGRLRQHTQLGVEILGEEGPYADAELILLGKEFFFEIGIKDYTVHVNSLGCQRCSNPFKEELKSFLREKREGLCSDCQERLLKNPLRVFDCKNEECQKIYEAAPKISNFLCPSCAQHFASFLSYLSEMGIKNYQIHERLVRGIDYYTRTVFEFVSEKLGSQNSFGGGGRYDNLLSQLGGEERPAIGFALGLERLLLLTAEEKEENNLTFLIFLSFEDFRRGKEVISQLRSSDIPLIVGEVGEKLKKQLKRANTYNARWVLILGEEEWKKGVIGVKDMAEGKQWEIKREEVVDFILGGGDIGGRWVKRG
ncbi:MAG: histidine--tRNA ligase [candidate division WOR-3 bacterium]